MGKNSKLINKTKGLLFYKFLGTGGKNGFSLWPDWSTYALLTTWENEEDAKNLLVTVRLFLCISKKQQVFVC